MRRLTLIVHSCLLTATALLVSAAVPTRAAACSCLRPTVESSYNSSTDVVAVEILRATDSRSTRAYYARVLQTFKGCLARGDLVVLKTPTSSAVCGTTLESRRHLITGTAAGRVRGLPALSIGLCGYNPPLSELTEHDREFLNGRTVCCGEQCTCADGTRLVQCFVDPCTVAPECSEGECVANYCGGCNAEFYDERGYAVCQDDAGCDPADPAACAPGTWCRQAAPAAPNAAPTYECVPFAAEGDRCNGFTLPWEYERCAAPLVCDTPDFTADAPGICRPACSCKPSGCSGQVCSAEDVVTTCEWRPEYACYQDATVTQCGCLPEGGCGWSQTEALKECLAAAGGVN